jgi:ABC-type microcin C transport system permease subunit YejE
MGQKTCDLSQPRSGSWGRESFSTSDSRSGVRVGKALLFRVTVGTAILAESGVSFLGLGVQPSAASWGKELRIGFTYLEKVPLFPLAPGLMITLAVLGFNFLGDGLRDALDPRLKGSRQT